MAIEKDEHKQLDMELDNSSKAGDQSSAGSNKIKDPDEWTTGDEPMTGAQRSYIKTLSGGVADENMTKSEAAKFIDEHKQQAGNNISNGSAGNAIKNPDDWATGDEDMTDAQRSYLKTLADEVGESSEENLTKAEASKRIEDLQQKTGRGLNK